MPVDLRIYNFPFYLSMSFVVFVQLISKYIYTFFDITITSFHLPLSSSEHSPMNFPHPLLFCKSMPLFGIIYVILNVTWIYALQIFRWCDLPWGKLFLWISVFLSSLMLSWVKTSWSFPILLACLPIGIIQCAIISSR